MLQATERDELLDPDELAALLGVRPSTVRSWRSRGMGPRYVRIGGGYRYRRIDIDAYLDAGGDAA